MTHEDTLCLQTKSIYASHGIPSSLHPSRYLSISNGLANIYLNTHFEDPLALLYLPSLANQTKATCGCVASRENPPDPIECGAPLLSTSGPRVFFSPS